jgi:hypothetical protein
MSKIAQIHTELGANNEQVLVCPICRGSYLHQESVTTVDPVIIEFSCENCSQWFDALKLNFEIEHHKGQTFLRWRVA